MNNFVKYLTIYKTAQTLTSSHLLFKLFISSLKEKKEKVGHSFKDRI